LYVPLSPKGLSPQSFQLFVESLWEYLHRSRSDLGSGFRPGWGSFHKLPGPSRGPRSKGLAPPSSVWGPSVGPDPVLLCPTPPPGGGVTCVVGNHTGRPPEGAPHVTPPWGGATWPLEAMGFPPHIPHLRARASQARGRCVTASHQPRGEPPRLVLSAPRPTGRVWGHPHRVSILRGCSGAREALEPGHIRRSPLRGVPASRGSRRYPGRHVSGRRQ